MRKPRIYQPGPLSPDSDIVLDTIAGQHLVKVLRLREGSELILFDGLGCSFNATLTGSNPKSVSVSIAKAIQEQTESPLSIHLGLAMSKGERMDYAIQKSVEAGVTQITPMLTENTVVKLDDKRKQTRLAHWQGISRHACEQSGRIMLPRINPIADLTELITGSNEQIKLILDTQSATSLGIIDSKPTSICVLIGPEGGFSEAETGLARQNGFLPILLGPRIFRTETAAVAICTAIQTLWGDLV